MREPLPVETRRAGAEYARPAPEVYRLGGLRHRLWNQLARRVMVYWRNAFWRVQPVDPFTPLARRSRSIWGTLFGGIRR